MRWRQVIALYVVLVALGGVYWMLGRRTRPGPPAGPPQRPSLLRVATRDVRAITVTRGERRIRARRAGERWEVLEPAGADIPSDLVAAFAQALADAEEIQRVGGAGADPAVFGLGEGAARVELELADGSRIAVLIGETNANGTAVYARREGSEEVVLIGRNLRYYEDLLFQALPAGQVPAGSGNAPVGG